MKIALLIHELLMEGGGERQCIALAQNLRHRGHHAVIYTSVYDKPNCFPSMCERLRIEVVGRGALPWIKKPLPLRGYFDMKHMASVIDEEYAIWNPHHWPAPWGAVWLKKKMDGRVVWMCNDVPNFHPQAQHHPRDAGLLRNLLSRVYYWYDRRQTREIDLTVLVSKSAECEFQALYDAPTQVLGPGFDPERFMPEGNRDEIRRRLSYADDDFVLLWLGIFMPHRRLEDALSALSILLARGKKVRLLLAGTTSAFPDYFAMLKGLAVRLGVDEAVTFAGKVPDGQIRDYYRSCDAFLFPNDLQTWGLAVLEAMACGCPVLVSRGAGVQEALSDGENALLFPPRDPATLADKVEALIDQPETREAIARRGMELVVERYTWERYASTFIGICDRVSKGEPVVAGPVPAPNPQGVPDC